MIMKEEKILDKILREVQDIKVMVQENMNDIDYLVKKESDRNNSTAERN